MSKASDQNTDTTVSPQTTAPGRLSALARRLRTYAASEVLWDLPDGYRDDTHAASQVIDRLAQIGAALHTATADDVLEAVRDLVGGR